MSNSNYTLEIISHHPKFNAKSLKKYYVDGIETVGAWGDEPFEVRFRNNTWQKVQVKLSLDGTDILTGKPADTQVSKDMWVVNGYSSISLKAWPETNFGGAAFIFTSANNSVAVHTHGDLSSRGIIAAAVFTEGHVEPIRFTYTPPVEHHHHHHDYWRLCQQCHHYPLIGDIVFGSSTGQLTSPTWTVFNNSTTTGNITKGYDSIRNKQFAASNTSNAIPSGNLGGVYSCNSVGNIGSETIGSYEINDGEEAARGLEELVSVGAGEHVDQKITYVAGLIKPMFSETVRVKYMWYDDLVAKLREATTCRPQPSGFPGDCNHKNIDLKCTPRKGAKKGVFRRAEQEPVFARF